RQTRLHSCHDLGEVPGHRPLVPAADLDVVAITEDDRPEAVPFRLVAHRAAGYGRDRLGENGGDRGHQRKSHEPHLALWLARLSVVGRVRRARLAAYGGRRRHLTTSRGLSCPGRESPALRSAPALYGVRCACATERERLTSCSACRN